MTQLQITIEKASSIAGNQSALARKIGVPPSHVSGWKKDRPCSARARVMLAHVAQENVALAALEGMLDTAERTGDEDLAAVLREQVKVFTFMLPR